MHPDDPSPATPGEVFYARTVALIVLGVLSFLLYWILAPFFAPLAWALFFAFLLHPLHLQLVRTLGGRTNTSAALLALAMLLLLLGPLTFLGAAFAAQAGELLQYAQRIAADHGPSELADLRNVPVIGNALGWLQETFGVTAQKVQSWIIEGARTILQPLASLGGRIFIGALGTLVSFVLMMVMLFFIIRDGQQMFSVVRALIPMSSADKGRLFGHLAAVTRAIVFGSGVTALVQGTLIGIGFAIAGLPSPIVFGVLAALFALVPMAGTPVIWVPAVIVLVIQQRWYAAIFLLVWGAMVATIDNFLRPLLVAGRADVGTLTVFIGVLGGVSAFGPIGVFLGPLVLALVIALIRFTLDVRQAESNATATSDSKTRT
jgi:predicted PurR-regulated permease PerM